MRDWQAVLVLGAVGYAINMLAIPLLPGVHLLLGDVPALMAAVAYGPWAGAAAGALAASRTLTLWGHPFGVVLFALQAAAVGALRKRMRPAFAVALYWAVVGLPLGVAAYAGVMEVPWTLTWLIVLKQPLNGLLNALVAEGLILLPAVRRPLGLARRPTVGEHLGVLTALASGIPLATLWIVHAHTQWEHGLDTASRTAILATRALVAAVVERERPGPEARDDFAGLGWRVVQAYPGAELYVADPGGALAFRFPDARRGAESVPLELGHAAARRTADMAGPRLTTLEYSTPSHRVSVVRSYAQALVAAQRAGSEGRLAWVVVPYRSVLNSIVGGILLGEAVALAALLTALGLSLLMARRVHRPLLHLVTLTGRLEEGDLDARADRGVIDDAPAEPALLGERLNALAERLQSAAEERAGHMAAEREARRRMTDIFESITDAFFAVDRDWRFTYLNRAAERLLVRPRDELLGRVVWDEFPEAVGSSFWAMYHRAVEQRVTVQFEEFFPPLDRWFEVRAYPSPDGLSVYFRDVTERKEAERQLAERAKIDALSAEVGMVVTEGESLRETLQRCCEAVVRHLDVAFARIWTLSEAEQVLELRASAGMYTRLDGRHARIPVGRYKIGLIASERAPHLTNDVQRDSRVSDKEWANREGMVAFAGYPLMIGDRVVGVLALFSRRELSAADLMALRTVSDRIALAIRRWRAEEERIELLERERQARAEAERRAREEAALRHATHAVTATFSVDEVIERIAQSALVATGADGAFVERIDIRGNENRVVAMAGEPTPRMDARTPYAGSFAQLVLERAEPELIERLAAADRPLPDHLAELSDCSAAVIPLLDAGEAIGALMLLRRPENPPFTPDEVARAHTFGDLAALAFRKIHLLEDSEEKREALERLIESRARLIRGFSHDLKNPLGAADGYAALLEEGIWGELDPKQRQGLGNIRRSITAALGLITDLVELARAEAGQLEIRHQPVDVREVAREMAEEHRAQATGTGLAVRTELARQLPVVDSDARRIRQVLGNLISNAVKYTEEGEIIIRVATRRGGGPGPDDGEWVTVEVSDTGIGIPAEKQHLLFQEFSRIEPGERPGAGLGLAISRRIARALGGEITVASEVGRGSTFTLWLPLTRRRSGGTGEDRPAVAGSAAGGRP